MKTVWLPLSRQVNYFYSVQYRATGVTMGVPLLRTLEECADYSKTVEPYFSQLSELPGKLAQSATDPDALLAIYKNTNPLVSGFAFSIFLGCIFLAVSEFNRNYSQVDRLWSLLPTIYNAHFAAWVHLNKLPTQRVDIILFWSAIWSVSWAPLTVETVEIFTKSWYLGTFDLQLLEKRWLYCWFRGL